MYNKVNEVVLNGRMNVAMGICDNAQFPFATWFEVNGDKILQRTFKEEREALWSMFERAQKECNLHANDFYERIVFEDKLEKALSDLYGIAEREEILGDENFCEEIFKAYKSRSRRKENDVFAENIADIIEFLGQEIKLSYF